MAEPDGRATDDSGPLAEARRRAGRLVGIGVHLVAEPPFVPPALRPGTVMGWVGRTVVLPGVHRVLERIDLTGLILENVSVSRLVDAVDPDEVVSRVDLSPIVDRVLQEVDLSAVLRSSSDSIVTDAVRGVRLQAAAADGFVERVVGHVVPGRRRRRARAAAVPAAATSP